MPRDEHLALFDAPEACARWSSSLWQIWWARSAGASAIAALRDARLAQLVRYARRRSALYRDAYRDVPESDVALNALPVMARRDLMARFDDWLTDPSITRRSIEAFVADPANVGRRFRDRYLVWKSSGTTGEPGLYVQDAQAIAVYDALIAAQLSTPALAPRYAQALLRSGARSALIAATGEHYASTVSWERVCRSMPGVAARCLSIMSPLDRLVSELNAFEPSFVASYPTMLALLADERAAGRLRIAPSIVWSAGENLAPATRAKLGRAFGCPIVNEYGASECMSIAFGCDAGWLHVNADWVIVEPVDAGYRPAPPGEPSHTVLVTNLANRVQPLIRYDLGDAVVGKTEPCECGNPLPAIRVEGRTDDVLAMRRGDGRIVRLVPQALVTVTEESSGAHRFQILGGAGNRLSLRIAGDDPRRRRSQFEAAARALRRYLAEQGVHDARVAFDERPPTQEPRSGKLRQVVNDRSRPADP